MSETLVKEGRAADALSLLDREKAAAGVAGRQLPRGFEADRAGALIHAGRIAEAQAAMKEEIRLFPYERRNYGDLGAMYLLEGNVSAANALMEQLASAIPERGSYDLAAQLFEHFHQPAIAAQWRNRATSIPQ
jgi:Flp pilus assembly protein TadD